MRVYIAAPYPLREMAIGVMRLLEGIGVEVTSSWLKAEDEMTAAFARQDLADVMHADLLLALNPDGWHDKGTGGRHVEYGVALALGKPIILVGERSNIFHHLATRVVPDIAAAILDAVAHPTLPPVAAAALTPGEALVLVAAEFMRAHQAHAAMHSPHEGYAVLLEEVDELWTEVKRNRGRSAAALNEATQVAAMGLRYLVDLS